MFFADNAEIDAYVDRTGYSGGQRLCFGVAMAKNNQNDVYEYHVKFNASLYDGKQLDIPGNQFVTRVDRLAK